MIISFSAWVKIVEIKRWCSRIVLLERGFMLLEIVKRSFTLKPSALAIAVAVGTVTVEPFRAIPTVLGLSCAFLRWSFATFYWQQKTRSVYSLLQHACYPHGGCAQPGFGRGRLE